MGEKVLLKKKMTVEKAKEFFKEKRWYELKGKCEGFCHEGPPTDEEVEIFFKTAFEVSVGETKWTSYKEEAVWTQHTGFIDGDEETELFREQMTVDEAKAKARVKPYRGKCGGFYHEGP